MDRVPTHLIGFSPPPPMSFIQLGLLSGRRFTMARKGRELLEDARVNHRRVNPIAGIESPADDSTLMNP